ncbi:MAG: hypothetical protein WKF97_24095 [Chitinophagaceae bacterium]
MKVFLPLILALLIVSSPVLSQTCTSTAVTSPNVTQPTNPEVIFSSTCSTLVVGWQGTSGQSFCVNATYFNTTTNKIDTVGSTEIICDGSLFCLARLPVIAGTSVTWRVEARTLINGTLYSSYPLINVLEYPIRACSGSGVKFSGKVTLQGAYNTSTGQMNTTLNSLGILQGQASSQPYNILPFGYSGTERVGAGFFAANPDIVDWVLLELRDPNAPLTVLGRRAVFVKRDGTLVDTGGTNVQITFPGLAAGSYHVAVRHRNHLGMRTAIPLDFSCGLISHNFSTAGSRTFQNRSYTSEVQMGSSPWLMRAGDANVNKNVRYTNPGNDPNHIFNTILGGSLSRIITNTYAPEDLNMDGVIKWTNPGNEQNFLLNIIMNGLFSTIFEEQL